MRSIIKQRLAGAFLVLVGSGYTYWMWLEAVETGSFRVYLSVLFPFFAMVGVGALLFPIDMEKVKAKYGIEKIESMKHMPRVWWVLSALALSVGAANWYFLKSGLVFQYFS